MQDQREIVVHGGGYCGLTVAIHYALAGVKVTIYDPDSHTVDGINSGQPRAGEYLGYIDRDVRLLVSKGLISATTDFDAIKNKYVHLLDVPTEKLGEPFLEIVKNSIINLSNNVPNKSIIIVESTLQPGTIDEILPQITRTVGEDLFIAIAFRQDWFADKDKNVTTLPRYVGGVTTQCTKEAMEIASIICKDVRPTRYREAELGKAGQNALYFVQIMGAYRFAYEYNDADTNEVLKIISSHWRIPDLYLNFGTSGRCVAAGAKYLVAGAKNGSMPLMEDAIDWDKKWRYIVADTVANKLHVGDKTLVLGMAYRPNFTDMGYSAGLDVAKALKLRGMESYVHDSRIPINTLKNNTNLPISSVNNSFKAVLLATAHDEYLTLPENPELWSSGQIVLDSSGAWEKYKDNFEVFGVHYLRVGSANWLGTKIPMKRDTDKDIFDSIDTEEKAYWLGYVYADGCVDLHNGDGYSLRLVSKDRDIVEKFSVFMGGGHIHLSTHWMNYTYQISSKHIVETLMKYGTVPNKTFEHDVPVYIPEDEQLKKAFFRGLFDGDGSLFAGQYKYAGRKQTVIGINISGLNIALLEKCKEYFGVGSVQLVSKKLDGYKWVYMSIPEKSLPVLDKIYGGYIPYNIRMERKYNRFLNYKEGEFTKDPYSKRRHVMLKDVFKKSLM
jgi:UDP-N-acetyl-D-glucosamine dehydrogenase